MRAYSSKKYNEPVVTRNSVILISKDGTEEIRVQAPIKYIDIQNYAKVYKPRVQATAVPLKEHD